MIVRLRKNGPYVIDDDVQVVDWNGVPYPIERRPVALCRCGASTRKPFCDGTHSKKGFDAAETAVTDDGDRSAQGPTPDSLDDDQMA